MTDIIKYFGSLKKRGYHDSSIAFMMISIRQLWKFLYLQREVDLEWQLIPVPKYSNRSFIPADEQDARKILGAVGTKDFAGLRDRLIISFLASSGVRVSELCELNIGDLHLSKRFASIISKKNRKRRMVLWNDETHKLLLAYLDEREKIAFCDALIIGIRSFKRITTRSVQRIVKKYRHLAGIIKPITPHSFRHGVGMKAVEANMNMRYIQTILGHKNLNSSQIYMDYKDENLLKEYRKVFNNKKSAPKKRGGRNGNYREKRNYGVPTNSVVVNNFPVIAKNG